jgi:CheY-like chemotaxis protein/two-component sensor histidine kinase
VRLIAQDLKAFSRVDSERRTPVDVRRVLDSSIDIAANEIRHRARLVRDYRDVPAVEADPSRLGQVFLNLLVNAVQAMDEGDAARNEIRVTTRTNIAGSVVVTISDTGAGIPPAIQARIFEPFFTTKPAGVGTGLGLAICKSIVGALGGEIAVESEVGKGTTFRVVLPATSASPATPALGIPALRATRPSSDHPASRPHSAPTPKRGRVLIVDDEPVLASALGRSLEADYEVVVAGSGREGLDVIRRDDRFDFILCDLIMPAVTGMDLYEEVRRTKPALAERIIFMSGGTFTPRTREFLATVKNPALDKPFDLSALNALLRARARAR